MLLPTPDGWTTLTELRAGDLLLGPDGCPVPVAAASERIRQAGWRVTLSCGATLDLAGHQRLRTQARSGRRGGDLAVDFIARKYTEGADARPVYAATIAAPFQLPTADLPLDPYVLGAWLGDGDTDAGSMTSSVVNGDQELIRLSFHAAGFGTRVREGAAGFKWGVFGLVEALRREGLLGNKHIPAAYLRAAHLQRLHLLQGLMDTDGSISASNQAEYTSKLRPLALAVQELVRTLGVKARLYESRATLGGIDHGPVWVVSFYPPPSLPAFRLPRKLDKLGKEISVRSRTEYLHDLDPLEAVTFREILIDSPHGAYLAGESMTPVLDSRTPPRASTAAVREWARKNGLPVGRQGPVNEALTRAYLAAQRGNELG